jgi:putative tryptophan/tyrosine transport system substrate-binding protein
MDDLGTPRQRVKRRDAIRLLSGVVAWPLAARARAQARRRPVIGFLRAGEPPKAFVEAFERGLREHGFVAGQDVVIEFKLGNTEEMARLAEELVRSKVDVILANASSAAVAAKRATTSIPIVMAAVYYPVELGIVRSLGHPGGNITGTAVTAGDMAGKRLELLRELVPTIRRVTVLSHLGHPSNAVQIEAIESSARTFGVQIAVVPVRREHEFEPAAASARNSDALLHPDTPLFNSNRARLVRALAKLRLPAIHPIRAYPDEGGLVSYGAEVTDLFRRSGAFVARILKGAQPADLPVEQPAKFELVINLKTARALGVTVPQSLTVRADEIIE